MLIAKEAPFEKLTPEACRTAFPLKLRAPDGSLLNDGVNDKVKERKKLKDHTQFLKSWKTENQNYSAMEVFVFVRDAVRKGDPRQDLPQVDRPPLDEKWKILGERKDLYHEERKLVVVF
jgi:hypothetical protein